MRGAPAGSRVACWSCAGPTAEAQLCPSCGVVLPADLAATPFARLGLPVRFDVDEQEMERAWLLRSSKVHPDRFVKRSDRERRFAVEQTAALNDAKRAVKDPFDRATWLVAYAAPAQVAHLDPRLLMSLMEARERAQESAAEQQLVVDAAVARFRSLAAALPQLLSSLSDQPALAKAQRALAEMKTLARLASDLGGPALIAGIDLR